MPQPMGGFKNLEYNCKIDKSFSHKWSNLSIKK